MRQLLESLPQISEEEEMIFGQGSGRDFILATRRRARPHGARQLSVLEGSQKLEALELVDANPRQLPHQRASADHRVILAHLEPGEDRRAQAPARPFRRRSPYRKPDFISRRSSRRSTKCSQELATLGSIDTQQLGGVQPIAEMLNIMDKTSEQNIMARVEEKDPQLAEEIRKLMFVFEDIIYIDDRGMQQLLKGAERQAVIAPRPLEEIKKIFRNMSKRAGQLLKTTSMRSVPCAQRRRTAQQRSSTSPSVSRPKARSSAAAARLTLV